jgi:hypothetical protein
MKLRLLLLPLCVTAYAAEFGVYYTKPKAVLPAKK